MSRSHLPLRILHLTLASDAGGTSRYIFDMCKALKAHGHEVTVAGDRGAWHWLFQKAPWPWIDIPLHRGALGFWQSIRTLRRYLRQHPVDLVHTHYRRATALARRVGGEMGIPILYTAHLSHMLMGWRQRLFNDWGDHTHVASEMTRQWLMEDLQVPMERITFIPHGVDTLKFPQVSAVARAEARAALEIPDTNLAALYVGRLDYPKNEEWLLDVALALSKRGTNLRMFLAGEGPNRPLLEQRIARQGLEETVRLLGHRDPLPLYQAADALLLPSLREGFSLVCAEAMSVGIPVLRTRTSGTQELIIENVTGRSTPIDHDAFVTAALEFLSDPAKLADMGRAAAAHVREHFTFQRQADRTLELYRQMVHERAAR